MRRRDFLTRSLSVCAGAALVPGFARTANAAVSPNEGLREYSSRAIDLVQQSNVIDMLSLPTLDWSLLDRWHQSQDSFVAADFQKLRGSGVDIFHPAVAFESVSRSPDHSYNVARGWFEKWNRFIAWHPDYFLRIETSGDLQRARQENKIGIILGMQDANHLRAAGDVDEFYRMGQRLTQLTYNSENSLGDGCKVSRDKGLTEFGGRIVGRMNSIGMAIDISHCGQRTSMDVIAASKKPVLITHSNCRALAPGVVRCKADEVIQGAARTGGVLGITSVRQFVRSEGNATVDDVLDHFDHAVKLVGIEHVGLGSDFDLDAHPTYDIPGLNCPTRVYRLVQGLVQRGYTDDHVALILGGNFQRALGEIWT